MNIINAIKTGSVVNLSINGKLEKKVSSNLEEANKLYRMVLSIKEDPTDENIKMLYAYLNDTTRIATILGLEVDIIDGKTYLEGFNTPIPQNVVELINEYYENDFPCESIINFWKLLMVNPDERVRDTLFGFLTKHNFVLTEHGYFLTYKAVKYYAEPVIKNDLNSFVSEKYDLIKNKWKKSPKNFGVYVADGKYSLVQSCLIHVYSDRKFVGFLDELYNSNVQAAKEVTVPIYTDKHTGTMRIELGVPVKKDRKDCDGDPMVECSFGIHVGSVKYVQSFGNQGDTFLSCLVNPAHVVAVPDYDNSKMRVCEYFPLSVVENFSTLEPSKQPVFFESDYMAYEKTELEEMVEMVKQNQQPIQSAIKSNLDSRSMEELLKIIESRLVDLK